MSYQDVYQALSQYRVIPIIAIESVDAALPLADALIAGGLPVIEITFRTKAAEKVIEKLSTERPDLLIGAGTILNVDDLRAAKLAGARFAVAPGLNPSVLASAQKTHLPFMPGVATPSEVEQAMGLGASMLKVFPAGVFGGMKLVKALSGPYGHTGVRFIPTGGVNGDNLADYLAMPAVAAVGGTWLAPKSEIAAGNWDLITERCTAAVATAAASTTAPAH